MKSHSKNTIFVSNYTPQLQPGVVKPIHNLLEANALSTRNVTDGAELWLVESLEFITYGMIYDSSKWKSFEIMK